MSRAGGGMLIKKSSKGVPPFLLVKGGPSNIESVLAMSDRGFNGRIPHRRQ